jgi:hypothetical protein
MSGRKDERAGGRGGAYEDSRRSQAAEPDVHERVLDRNRRLGGDARADRLRGRRRTRDCDESGEHDDEGRPMCSVYSGARTPRVYAERTSRGGGRRSCEGTDRLSAARVVSNAGRRGSRAQRLPCRPIVDRRCMIAVHGARKGHAEVGRRWLKRAGPVKESRWR